MPTLNDLSTESRQASVKDASKGDVCAAGLGTFMTRRVHKTDPKGMAPPAG